jgi:hypothetical protein
MMTPGETMYRQISEQDASRILGLERQVPLTPQTMARGLRVTFFPIAQASQNVLLFSERLRQALISCGVRVLEFAEATDASHRGKLQENLIVIAAGELVTGNLPVDHVQNLRTATIVGIIDGPCPAEEETADQDKLNRVVHTLAWSIVQVAIYVDPERWTITTMNGAVIPCSQTGSIVSDVLNLLVPKLAAPVVPPHAADFDLRPGVLDLTDSKLRPYVDDFVRSGPLWEQTGLLLFHTSMDQLEFRNGFYKRIAAAYLDHRSGMSYGFLARQTATEFRPSWADPDHTEEISLAIAGQTIRVSLGDVWVLTSRSGCDKSHIDPARDLLMMGLTGGQVVIATPRGLDPRVDCKPSYDTLTILAHAVGNRLVASAMRSLKSGARFSSMLANSGAALAHWHGYVASASVPEGYTVHGTENPPVSCSTYQAALFALTGKLGALSRCLVHGKSFEGDVHVEPHHGVNVTGPSLTDLARWAITEVVGERHMSMVHSHPRVIAR